jgi:hypothetical protein
MDLEDPPLRKSPAGIRLLDHFRSTAISQVANLRF